MSSLWRPVVLGVFALVFGVEIGFKLASNQVTSLCLLFNMKYLFVKCIFVQNFLVMSVKIVFLEVCTVLTYCCLPAGGLAVEPLPPALCHPAPPPHPPRPPRHCCSIQVSFPLIIMLTPQWGHTS